MRGLPHKLLHRYVEITKINDTECNFNTKCIGKVQGVTYNMNNGSVQNQIRCLSEIWPASMQNTRSPESEVITLNGTQSQFVLFPLWHVKMSDMKHPYCEWSWRHLLLHVNKSCSGGGCSPLAASSAGGLGSEGSIIGCEISSRLFCCRRVWVLVETGRIATGGNNQEMGIDGEKESVKSRNRTSPPLYRWFSLKGREAVVCN